MPGGLVRAPLTPLQAGHMASSKAPGTVLRGPRCCEGFPGWPPRRGPLALSGLHARLRASTATERRAPPRGGPGRRPWPGGRLHPWPAALRDVARGGGRLRASMPSSYRFVAGVCALVSFRRTGGRARRAGRPRLVIGHDVGPASPALLAVRAVSGRVAATPLGHAAAACLRTSAQRHGETARGRGWFLVRDANVL